MKKEDEIRKLLGITNEEVEDFLKISESIYLRDSLINKMYNYSSIGYMCKTDFYDELGHASGGNTVYPSINDLIRRRKCVDQCGIVEVKITLNKIIDDGKI